MAQLERVEILVLGSGAGGKLLAWHMARAGRRTAVVERRWIGGSCPNVNCLPSKNEIWSANVVSLVRRGAEFGAKTGRVTIDMATVRDRKRRMLGCGATPPGFSVEAGFSLEDGFSVKDRAATDHPPSRSARGWSVRCTVVTIAASSAARYFRK